MATFFAQLPAISKGRVGILGGSFDPPHLGHQVLAQCMLTMARLDEVWIIPCQTHAFNKNLSPFALRFELCMLAFRHMKNVHVLDVESHLPAPNYTFDTLQFLKNQKNNLQLVLGMGSDLISDFPKWHKSAQINDLAELCIFGRYSFPLADIPTELVNAQIFPEFLLPNINSTKLRKELALFEDPMQFPFLDQEVVAFIKEEKLYQSTGNFSRD